jgi:hypothetical protein
MNEDHQIEDHEHHENDADDAEGGEDKIHKG